MKKLENIGQGIKEMIKIWESLDKRDKKDIFQVVFEQSYKLSYFQGSQKGFFRKKYKTGKNNKVKAKKSKKVERSFSIFTKLFQIRKTLSFRAIF